MKFKYFVLFGGKNPDDGVNKKIHAQISELTQQGIDVEMILLVEDLGFYPSFKYLTIHALISKRQNAKIKRFCRILEINSIFHHCIKKLKSDDIFYCRYTTLAPVYFNLNYLKKRRTCLLVTEHQTIESNEDKMHKDILPFFCDKFLGKYYRRQSDAIVGVTDEITEYQLKKGGDANKPHITIGNGIKINSVIIRQPPPYDEYNINLLFIASGTSRWHGLDRILSGLLIYKDAENITLHIVGEGSELPNLIKIAHCQNLNDQVIFHGFKSGEELDALFNQCHIAIGSLGIHRIGLSEASTLKAREYCARGIPYIIACGDPDFPDEFPYIFRVPPDESPIDIESVIQFTQKVFSDPEHPQKMREYAEEHLDWSVKMKKLKKFLETLVEGR